MQIQTFGFWAREGFWAGRSERDSVALRDAGGPLAFAPPTGGVAPNGQPVFNWDQAAAQLTRESNGWGGLGNPATVTFAFRSTAPVTMPSDTGGFSRFNSTQITFTLETLDLWSEVANVTFNRVGTGTSGEGAFSNSATILFANYATGEADASAFAFLPGSSGILSVDGDVWINISLSANFNLASDDFGQHTLAHEIGHAIGLSHPGDYNGAGVDYATDAVYWQDSRMFTIMSYFGSANVDGSLNAFSSGPQLHDIAAAQLLYGANMSTRLGDTVYGFNSNTGHAHFTINGAGDSPVFAIWDAGGNDTLDLSGYATPSEIDLREEAFSGAGPGNGGFGVAHGNISIARGAIIENAIGGSGADTLIGNAVNNVLSGNAGNDTLDGGSGDDTLDGGAGADALQGGAGFDTVTYASSSVGGTVRLWNGTGLGGDTLSSIEAVIGSSFADNIIGANGVNAHLSGGGGKDFIAGLNGDDVIDGGDGADTLIGGLGFDTVSYASASQGGTVRLWNGTGPGGDTLSGIEAVVGSNFADSIVGANGVNTHLSGGGGNDFIAGLNGDDVIDGGAGADTLAGGAGNDSFVFQTGQANGDAISDFDGNGAGVGDSLELHGYGAAIDGASVVQLDATHWQINSADGTIHDTITLTNAATIDASDYVFGT